MNQTLDAKKKFNFHLDIPKLAFPLILSNATIPILGLINTMIVGHFGNTYYLAAIGLGTMIFDFMYWGLGFFRMTTTGLVSHAYGEKNKHKINDILVHSVWLAIVIGSAIIILQQPLYYFFSLWMHPNAQVIGLLYQYYAIRIWAAPAVLINLVIVGVLIGIQKTRGPLILLATINFIAIILSLFLGVFLDLKLIGIACSDILSQYIGLLIGIYLLSHYLDFKKVLIETKIKFYKFKPLLNANRDIFIRSLCLITVFSFFTIWSGYISVLILAVNTLLMNFFQIMSNVLGGFDNVAETFSGAAIGEKNIQKFKKYIYLVGCWSLACSLLISILYFLFGHIVINYMTNIQSVVNTARDYMPFVVLFPLISFLGFLLDGVAIGANLFKEMRNSMILTVILFFGIWYLLKPYENLGLWLAFYSFFILRALFLGYFIRKFYRKNKVVQN